MDELANVDIDCGRFKYVLIEIMDRQTDAKKYIVRGYTRASYHGMDGNQLVLNYHLLSYLLIVCFLSIKQLSEKSFQMFTLSIVMSLFV